jgi:carboxymethylenebutenolidase
MDIELSTAEGAMPAVLVEPPYAPRGAVVVVQEAFGLNDHIISITERLAEAGYVAIAPALFHRLGSPTAPYDDFAAVIPAITSLTEAGITMDIDAALAELNGRGFSANQIGIVGFCMGGAIALHTATRGVVGAAVTFYGGGVTTGRFGLEPLVDLAEGLRAPWLGLYGDLDGSIPVDQVEELRLRAAAAAVPTQIVRYEDAGHGFNCDVRADYEPAAADDAWARCLSWFEVSLA